MTCRLAVSDKYRLFVAYLNHFQLKNEILDLESRVASSMTRMHMNDTQDKNITVTSSRGAALHKCGKLSQFITYAVNLSRVESIPAFIEEAVAKKKKKNLAYRGWNCFLAG